MPVRFNSGVHTVGSERLQLIIDYRINDPALTEYTFAEKEIYVKSWGEIHSTYNEEEFWLAVGTYNFELIDAGKWLYAYMYRDQDGYYTPRPKVELYRDYSGVMALEWQGYFIPTEIFYDEDTKTFSISAAPRTEILNATSLWYDKKGIGEIRRDTSNFRKVIGNETKFLSEIPMSAGQSYYIRCDGVPYIIESVESDTVLYTTENFNTTSFSEYDIFYSTNPFAYNEADDIYLKTLILDIFKKVNPSLSASDLMIKQNWQFMAWSQGDMITVDDIASNNITQVDDVPFEDIYCRNYLYIFDHTVRYDNLSELLKQLCLEYGCYAGMIGENKPFFVMLYDYLDVDVITIYKEQLISKPRFYYSAMPLEYVRFYSDYLNYHKEAGTFTDNDALTMEKQIPNAFFLNNSNARSIQTFSGLRCERLHGSVTQDFYIGLAKDARLSYPDAATEDPNLDMLEHPDYEEQMRMLADLHYRYRSELTGYFTAEFEIVGCNAKIYHTINYKDNYQGNVLDEYYQPQAVTVNFEKNTSKITARRIGLKSEY